jgi:hypothetical protein
MEITQKEIVSPSAAWSDPESKDVWAEQEGDVDFWCSEPTPGGSKVEKAGKTISSELESKVEGEVQRRTLRRPGQGQRQTTESEGQTVKVQGQVKGQTQSSECQGQGQTTEDQAFKVQGQVKVQGQTFESQGQGYTDPVEGKLEIETLEMGISETASPSGKLERLPQPVTASVEEMSHSQSDVPPIEQSGTPPEVKFDEASVEDDSNGDILVVDDSEGEDDGEEHLEWRPCLKNDPFPVEESSQLTLEEVS